MKIPSPPAYVYESQHEMATWLFRINPTWNPILFSAVRQYRKNHKWTPIQFNLICDYLGKSAAEELPPRVKGSRRALLGGEGLIRLFFEKDPRLVGRIKGLKGAKYHPDPRPHWTVVLSYSNAKSLHAVGFVFSTVLEAWWNGIFTYPYVDPINPPMKQKLYKHQMEGIAFVESRKGRALVGDDMGLGKTAQIIGWLEHRRDVKKAIVICPSSLKLNWMAEFQKWTSREDVHICSSKTPYRIPGNVAVVNYDILKWWAGSLRDMGADAIILDEIHYIKNRDTDRYKSVKAIAKGIPYCIGMSGTPIVNRPAEAFATLNLIRPDIFNDYWEFAKRFCGAWHNGFGWDLGKSTNVEELHQMLKSIMIRRTKEDELPDLPAKMRNVVPIELDNWAEYSTSEKNFEDWARDNGEGKDKVNALQKIEALKQLAVKGKLKALMDWIDNFLEESEESLVIMAWHINIVDSIFERYERDAVRVYGATSAAARDKAVKDFQSGAKRVFVGNIKSAGVGITLTKASHMAIVELPWTPGDMDQAEDRIHRIGQVQRVTIWYLLGARTIEMEIAELLDEKRKTVEAIIDGRATEEADLLMQLLKKRRRQNEGI